MENQELTNKASRNPLRPYRMILAAAAVAMAGTGIGRAFEKSEQREDAKSEQGENEAAVTLSQLPDQVRATLERNLQGGKIRALSKENEGEGNFEARIRSDGKDREIKISPSGQLLEVEEKLGMADLPARVRMALANMGGEEGDEGPEQVEKVTTRDGMVYYEATVEKGEKETEVKLSPEGTPYENK